MGLSVFLSACSGAAGSPESPDVTEDVPIEAPGSSGSSSTTEAGGVVTTTIGSGSDVSASTVAPAPTTSIPETSTTTTVADLGAPTTVPLVTTSTTWEVITVEPGAPPAFIETFEPNA